MSDLKNVIETFPAPLPESGWEYCDPARGTVADTYLHERYVLQLRDRESLMRELAYASILNHMDFSGMLCRNRTVLLVGPNGLEPLELTDRDATARLELRDKLEADGYWLLQKRLPGDGIYLPPGQLVHELDMEFCKKAALFVKNELAKLASFDGGYDLRGIPLSPNMKIQLVGRRQLLSIAHERFGDIGDWSDVPDERSSEIVLSHGDPLIKNILFHDGADPVLIDWETMMCMPRHIDYVHFVGYLVRKSDPIRWMEMTEEFWPVFADGLPDWSLEDWKVSMAWYVLREFSCFPDEFINDGVIETVKRIPQVFEL